MLTLLTFLTVKIWKFLKIQDGGGRQPEKSQNDHMSTMV